MWCICSWRKENQDAFVCSTACGGEQARAYFAVFDGHGFEGKKVSHYLVAHLPVDLKANAHFKSGDFAEAFRTSYPETNASIRRKGTIDLTLSGGTAGSITRCRWRDSRSGRRWGMRRWGCGRRRRAA